MNPTWRLSEYTPDNLGLAFTDEGLLLGRTPLIERRGGRFVVREPSDIARLVKYSFPGGVAVDRLMPGLARIASALNANDQAAARIAAVHLHIPDLPGSAARNAMVAEDALIKYARDQGGDSDWNPALQPRAGVPPNPGWFASTDGSQHEPKQDESSAGQSRLRFAENEDRSRRADAAPAVGDHETLQPGNPIDEPANFTDRPDWNHFWSDTWPAIKDWLEEPSRAVGWWRTAALASHCALPRNPSRDRGGLRHRGLCADRRSMVWSACSRSNYYRECCTWCRVRSAGTEGTWVGEEFAMGNHGRGPVNARRIDGCGIDRDQGRNLCERNQTITDSDRGGRHFGKGIDIDYRNENENKR